MALAPSQIVREAKRRAVREHPNAASVLKGRTASSLSKDELDNALVQLGFDPVVVANNAMINGALIQPSDDTCDNLPQVQTEETEMDKLGGLRSAVAAAMSSDDAVAIEAEVQDIRSLIVTGGFGALDEKLRALVTEARKPPVQVEVIREVQVERVAGAPVHQSKPTGRTATWKDLFGVRGAAGAKDCQVWDGSHSDTPAVDPEYLFPQPQTAIALSQIARKRNVFMFGAAGTGKSEFAIQLAARTGRPLAIISCDDGTDAATLVGMTTPDPAGGVSWQDGILTKAIRTPGCVVLIDEPAAARPGALLVFQNVLEKRVLYVAETGARIACAPGVLFLAADNTNGTGGGARKGFHGTHALNAAFMDRFGPVIRFEFLPEAKEIGVLVARTGCTPELAKLLVQGAAITRTAADNQGLSAGIGLRRLVAWAEMLTDGIAPDAAFRAAVLDRAPEQDQETLRQQLLLTYDKATVAAALNPSPVVTMPMPGTDNSDPTLTNPTPAGRAAAGDFAERTY